ncbi:hypothetical protein C8Q76DRAFT_854414 [Earliella scabrosa]|nr:hypothetical protein C8Q76DRAFT_854414 [Earliella scabrosa]
MDDDDNHPASSTSSKELHTLGITHDTGRRRKSTSYKRLKEVHPRYKAYSVSCLPPRAHPSLSNHTIMQLALVLAAVSFASSALALPVAPLVVYGSTGVSPAGAAVYAEDTGKLTRRQVDAGGLVTGTVDGVVGSLLGGNDRKRRQLDGLEAEPLTGLPNTGPLPGGVEGAGEVLGGLQARQLDGLLGVLGPLLGGLLGGQQGGVGEVLSAE